MYYIYFAAQAEGFNSPNVQRRNTTAFVESSSGNRFSTHSSCTDYSKNDTKSEKDSSKSICSYQQSELIEYPLHSENSAGKLSLSIIGESEKV
ncbi:hypothetical protein OSTOST_02323 [Ostertagia ostertagi]